MWYVNFYDTFCLLFALLLLNLPMPVVQLQLWSNLSVCTLTWAVSGLTSSGQVALPLPMPVVQLSYGLTYLCLHAMGYAHVPKSIISGSGGPLDSINSLEPAQLIAKFSPGSVPFSLDQSALIRAKWTLVPPNFVDPPPPIMWTPPQIDDN